MIELTRTNDPIRLAWLRTRLKEAQIRTFVFDEHTSTLYGGALAQITQRLFVAEADIARARLILAEAERLGNDNPPTGV